VVANAETGSGKTLCFLLPILQKLLHHSSSQSNHLQQFAMVLVPTPDLAHQANHFFNQLANDQFNSTVAHSNSRLCIKPSTHLIIATPSSLLQYDLPKLLHKVRILSYDEADVLFVGGHRKPSWEILKVFKRLAYKETSVIPRQLLLTAATVQRRGPQSVGVLLEKELPVNTVYVSTDGTHSIVPEADICFIDVPSEGEDKIAILVEELNQMVGDASSSASLPRVLVFCNSIASVKGLYDELENQTYSSSWWYNKTSQLHKEIQPSDRVDIVTSYKNGGINLLISTDIASRGIDLPDVTTVIMYDFPPNTIDFLHRAGRTARAGKAGQVMCYVGSSDVELVNEIKKSMEESSSLDHLFSRNKMLRRKFKRKETNYN
jgi:superfamily II DNA/RNA helicase